MALIKKTTILLPQKLYRRLTRLARARRTSMGALIRDACESQYGGATLEERLGAIRRLGALDLSVGTPEELKRQYVARPKPVP